MQQIFTDQMQRTVVVAHPPQRIVSLVPSQTALLHTLGLDKEVIGITKFCTLPPEWFHTKPRVGGTKQLLLDQIEKLQPDLIIGNKEENEAAQIEALATRFPVWMSNIITFKDALRMIGDVGIVTGRIEEARLLAESIESDFNVLIKPIRQIRAAYFIWQDPYMIAGNQTFINSMLQEAGFDNVFAHVDRYPEITLETLKAVNPEVIFLSSEPYPFKNQHIPAFQHVCQEAVVQIVDGALFSWYGSRLLHSAAYFRALHTDICAQIIC